MKRPTEDMQIGKHEFVSFVSAGLVVPLRAIPMELQGEKGMQFEWRLSQKASPLVRDAVIDYLSMCAYGRNYKTSAAYNDQSRVIGLVIYGRGADIFSREHFNQNQSARGR